MKLKTYLNNASSLSYTIEEIVVSIYHPINDLINISGLVIRVSHVQASCRVCIVTVQLDTFTVRIHEHTRTASSFRCSCN